MASGHARQLSAFMQISLDGYFCSPRGDMSFAHKPLDDVEWQEFVSGNAAGSGALVFGRATYDMMAAWWPTPAAATTMPEVAGHMNAVPKIVVSRSLISADWNNTTLVRSDLVGTFSRMKAEAGPDLTILGSGSIVRQLAAAGLVDAFQIVVNPVALGGGKSVFHGLEQTLHLRRTGARTFENGAVVLRYVPVR